MPRAAALPFILTRGDDAFSGTGFTSTVETIHGLLRFEEDTLVVQWRIARKTDHFGEEMRSDRELEPVREIRIPLSGVAGATVRRRWWDGFNAPRIVLTAADLRAFEAVTGEDGLKLDHPAELVLPVRRKDRLAAEEFSAELTLALAERGSDPGRRALPDRTGTAKEGPTAQPSRALRSGDVLAGGRPRVGDDEAHPVEIPQEER